MAIFQYNPERPLQKEPELYLQYWGKEDCVPGHTVGPGVRDIYKVHFIHKGTGIVQVGEQIFSLSAGQAFLIFPDVVTYYEADANDPWTYSWLGFYGTQAANALELTSLSPETPVFPMDVRVMPGLYDRLTEAASHENSAAMRLQAIIYEFMSVLIEAAPISAGVGALVKKQDTYVHQSMEFIRAHYSENMTVQQLSAYLGLDRKYLSALFKDSLGVPPQQYLLHYRIEKACELLSKGKYTVGEVSRSVGYQDPLLFSRMFKKVKGVSPKSYLSSKDINP